MELGWNIPATESADSMTFLIRFTMHDVRSGDYLDLVAAYDVDKGRHIERTGSGDRLAALKRSESEQRRQWEENKRNAARACLIYWAVTLIAGVALCVLSILAVALSHLRSRYRGPIAYWRDKPSVSPASAVRLVDIVDQGRGDHRRHCPMGLVHGVRGRVRHLRQGQTRTRQGVP